MARKLDSPCMFCGGLPCTCDTGQTKKSSKPTVKASSSRAKKTTAKSPDSTPSHSATEESTEDVFGEIPTQVLPKFKTKSDSESDRDLSYESAIRVLMPLLSEIEQRRVKKELNHPYPQDVDKRAARWKANRP